jgi:O-acetylhomoserine (thiol)-lyase
MAAISGLIFNMLKSGDEIIAASCLYGGALGLLKDTLRNLGIHVKFFDSMIPGKLESLITPQTKLIFVENLANPLLVVPDVEAISGIAKKHGIVLAVDNTIATPFLNNPIKHGADFVIHSCTKYLEGHGSIIGGMVVDAGSFEWNQERYPLLFETASEGKSYVEKYQEQAFLVRLREKILMHMGGCMPPLHAFLLIHGMESLHVRMERHCQNANKIAQYLAHHDKVAWVCYPGLEGHTAHTNAQKYLHNGFGGMLGFGLKGGYEACKTFIDNVKLLCHSTNIGDTKTLVIHPASTTHRGVAAEERKAIGISDDFIRMSVGIENADDLITEIENVLAIL